MLANGLAALRAAPSRTTPSTDMNPTLSSCREGFHDLHPSPSSAIFAL